MNESEIRPVPAPTPGPIERLQAARERLPYQPFLLGVAALLAGGALSLAYESTREHILAAEARDMQMTLAQVLPKGFADNDLLKDVVDIDLEGGRKRKVHVAKSSGRAVGAVFETAERGYSGEIRLLMAVDAGGRVLGVRVLKHTETPGLGDKIEIAKNPWIEGFAGKSLGDPAAPRWAVKKDGGVFDSFAGATITPRAVVKAVKGGLDFFAARRVEILGPAAGEKS